MSGWWRRFSPILGVALLVAALLVLRHELRALTFAQLAHTLGSLPAESLVSAIGLALLNYAVLTGYDHLAFVYIRRSCPRWQITLGSFVGYAMSNNLGLSMVSGTSARYRFYSRFGLSAGELSRIFVFYSGTFWVGLLVLGGWSLIVRPPVGLTGVVGSGWAEPAGLTLIGLAAAYVVSSFLVRAPLSIRGFRISIPSPPLVFAQLALSIADWILAVAILWVLLPEPRLPFIALASAFLGAQFLSHVSTVPGGLGVFETLMLLLLHGELEPAVLLPALIAFRVIYYLMPLVLALLVLLLDEWYQRRHLFQRWRRR